VHRPVARGDRGHDVAMAAAGGTHTEVETKLEVPSDAEPALGALLADDGPFLALPGVARVERREATPLVAAYHDTTGLHLARSRATLRRRTGGSDAGWHLKLPGRDGSRTEVHEPLGDADEAVPARLVTLTRSRHRGRGLGPVAVLRTARATVHLLDDDGAVLVEVADDHVATEVADHLVGAGGEATASWHEVEAELLGGDRRLLEAVVGLLVTAGARPSPAASKLTRALGSAGALRRPEHGAATAGTALAVVAGALRRHVEALVEEEPHVHLDSPDAVHKARVATRRLRSDLATFRPVLGRDATEPLRAALKELAGVLGAARDAEVLSARLQARLAALPPELVPGPVARRLSSELDGGYERDRAVAAAALDTPEHDALLEDLVRLCDDPPHGPRAEDPARRTTRRRARAAWRRLEGDLDAVPEQAGADRDAALHEVRKAAKRVRYAAESLGDLHGRRATRLASRAEDLQELLGEHQDATVAVATLRETALRAYADGENTFGYGVLAGIEQAGTAGTGPDDPDLTRAVQRLRRAAAKWFG
jgi:CHAD domain-containing protein